MTGVAREPSTILRADARLDVLPERMVQAYGVRWTGRFAVESGWATPRDADPHVHVRRATMAEARAMLSTPVEQIWAGATDGQRIQSLRGSAGEVSFHHGESTLAVFSAAQDEIVYAEDGADDLVLARTILDTVMHSVALELGRVAMHGAGLAGDAGSLIVVGRSGAGKSSLTASLLERGLRFVSDDIQVVAPGDGGELVSHPGPPVTTRPTGGSETPEAVLGTLDGEDWIAAAVDASLRPVRAVILLEFGEPLAVRGGLLGVLDLLDHMMGVPAQFGRERFAMLGDLVEQAELVRVTAHSAPPASLAEDTLHLLSTRGVSL